MTKPLPTRLRVCCPHCESPTNIRTSRKITPTYGEFYFQCTDIECGHTFAADLNIVRTIVPSSKPNPRVRIPLARPQLPANDNCLTPQEARA